MQKEAILHGKVSELPDEFSTLAQIIIHTAKKYPNKGLFYIDSFGNESFCSYLDLLDKALKNLYALQKKGLKAGDIVILEISEAEIFYPLFWACILGGIVPAPVTRPLSFEPGSEKLSKLFNIWQVLNQPLILVEEKYHKYYEQLLLSDKTPKFKCYSERQLSAEENGAIHLSKADDLALLQFSSGSTAIPKGVQLNHTNIITNLAAIAHRFNLSSADNTFMWVPHTHDMGLFMQYLVSVMTGCNIMIFSAYTFIRSPYMYLKKISEHKGTWFTSPNFAYDWMTKNVADEKLSSLDLSSLRFVINAAEPISVDVVSKFIRKFSVCGLKENTMCTAYGLAEATVAVTIGQVGTSLKINKVDRTKVINEGLIIPGDDKLESNIIEFVQDGSPINGMSIRIVDNNGKTVCENVIGEIQIRGASVTSGYYNNEAANQILYQDGWLRTGDLGFIRDGELTITGRIKDIIFIRGQNYYSHDLEEIIFKEGIVDRGNLALVGLFNPLEQQEELLAFVKHKVNIDNLLPVRQAIIATINDVCGIQVKHVIPVQSLPKTTSGKLQRFHLRKNYENGIYQEVLKQIEQSL